jgi:hypothetical protein
MLENLRVMNISSQLAKVEQVLHKKEEIINEKTLKAKEVRYLPLLLDLCVSATGTLLHLN